MAKDVIARLKADTSQWDSGFQKAGKSLKNFESQNSSLDGVLKQSIISAGKYVSAVGLIGGAMKVAKDAILSNEQNLDEWNRVVESSKALYEGFLVSLNSGSIRGYLDNMSSIVQAARDAYDAMDDLETYNAFNQKNMAKGRRNLNNAINDYREGIGSKDAVQSAADAYIELLKERNTKEAEAYRTQIDKIAKTYQVSSDKMYSILIGSNKEYEKAKKVMPTGEGTVTQSGVSFGYSYNQKVKVAANAEERMGQALREFGDDRLKFVQAIGAQEDATGDEVEDVRRRS